MNRLADRVAAGSSLSAAAKAIGVSKFRADYLWARIVARLREQAK
ncbi:hypothetical protein [Sphingomonas baiyangensis]|nr:hypothetical protein [Sphingomonas baiyangensis]